MGSFNYLSNVGRTCVATSETVPDAPLGLMFANTETHLWRHMEPFYRRPRTGCGTPRHRRDLDASQRLSIDCPSTRSIKALPVNIAIPNQSIAEQRRLGSHAPAA